MAPRVKPASKRAYDSTRRQAQARETQRLIAAVARDLFIERGYSATSVRDIADAAGVAVQTIYNAFDGGKPAILARVFDIGVVGDDEPVALADRDELRAILSSTDPRAAITIWTRMSTDIHMRFMPLMNTLREARSAEPLIDSLWRQNVIVYRHEGMSALAGLLKRLKALPKGMTVARATDVIWAYVSFDTAEALIVERGWTPDEYAEWSATALMRIFEIGAR
jgi:AcrR family transcriptional regulator